VATFGMADFREKYGRLCRDNRLEPLPTILDQVRESYDYGGDLLRRQLDLSTLCLSVEHCVVLAKCLKTDDTFTDLKLTDCILNDEGCKALCRGLKSNAAIRDIDLKGNSLRTGGAEAIGSLLKHNSTLTRLSLEWNFIGTLDEGVAYLADGLAVNKSLETLDLRSNQITHKGAGELASALRKNNTLKELDLRWNNCGLLGGRVLLSSLQHNKSLIRLDLTGNDVPNDILQSIAVALGRNVDQQTLKSQHQVRTTALTQEIKQLQEDSRIQISDLIGKLDQQKERFGRTSRSSQLKISQLQETLTETSHEKELLEAKYSKSSSIGGQ
jgi:hypothetical protein